MSSNNLDSFRHEGPRNHIIRQGVTSKPVGPYTYRRREIEWKPSEGHEINFHGSEWDYELWDTTNLRCYADNNGLWDATFDRLFDEKSVRHCHTGIRRGLNREIMHKLNQKAKGRSETIEWHPITIIIANIDTNTVLLDNISYVNRHGQRCGREPADPPRQVSRSEPQKIVVRFNDPWPGFTVKTISVYYPPNAIYQVQWLEPAQRSGNDLIGISKACVLAPRALENSGLNIRNNRITSGRQPPPSPQQQQYRQQQDPGTISLATPHRRPRASSASNSHSRGRVFSTRSGSVGGPSASDVDRSRPAHSMWERLGQSINPVNHNGTRRAQEGEQRLQGQYSDINRGAMYLGAYPGVANYTQGQIDIPRSYAAYASRRGRM